MLGSEVLLSHGWAWTRHVRRDQDAAAMASYAISYPCMPSAVVCHCFFLWMYARHNVLTRSKVFMRRTGLDNSHDACWQNSAPSPATMLNPNARLQHPWLSRLWTKSVPVKHIMLVLWRFTVVCTVWFRAAKLHSTNKAQGSPRTRHNRHWFHDLLPETISVPQHPAAVLSAKRFLADLIDPKP